MTIESDLLRAEIVTLRKQVDALSRRELPVSAVTLADGTVMRRSLQEKLKETVSLTDFGAVADDMTDLGLAVQAAIDAVQPGTVLRLPSSTTAYRWTSAGQVWDKEDLTLDARGCVINFDGGGAGKISVAANGGTIQGGRWRYTPNPPDPDVPASGQGSGSLFKNKSIAGGDTSVRATGWVVKEAIWENISVRFQKMGRVNVRIPLHYSKLNGAVTAVQTVLPLLDASQLIGALWVRVLCDNGLAVFREVLSLDVPGNTVTLVSPLGSTAPDQRRCTGVTITTDAVNAGMTILPVESTTLFYEDAFTSIILISGVAFTSRVIAIDPTGLTITIEDQLPNDVESGAPLQPLNDGTFATGSDIEAYSTMRDNEFRYYRSTWPVEFGGVTDCAFIDNYVHDIVRYLDALDPHYWTDYFPQTSEIDVVWGEGLKVTAGSDRIFVDKNIYERTARNAIDMYSGGGAIITNNTMRDLLVIGGIECKYSSTDLNPPKTIKIAYNTFENNPNYAILAGAPNVLIMGNVIKNAGLGGIYVNGAKDSDPGEGDLGDIANYTENVIVSNNRVMDGLPGAFGITVTEVAGASIVGNVCSGNYYNLLIGEKSTRCVIVGNVCRNPQSGGQDIRMLGFAGLLSQHEVRSNITTNMTGGIQLYDDEADYIVTNGIGTEKGLASGATPTLNRWPVGPLITNDTDNRLYLRQMTAWRQIATTDAIFIGQARSLILGYMAGVQAVATDVGMNITLDVNMTLQAVRLYAKTPSVGSALRVDIQRSTNGGTSFASIFSTLPICVASSHIGGTLAVFSTTTVNAGDVFRVDITQVGSTTPGSNLTVQLFGVTR